VIGGLDIDLSGEVFAQLSKMRDRLEPELVDAAEQCLARGHELIQDGIPTSSSFVGLGDSWQILEHAKRVGDSIVGSWGSTHPGAALREFGKKDIRPGKNPAKAGPNKGKPTRALTIPFNPKKTSKGLSTVIGILAAKGGTAKGGTFVKSGYSRGGAVTYEKEGIDLFPIYRPEYRRPPSPKTKRNKKKVPGKGEGFVPIFILATKATVLPHPYVRPAMRALREEARDIFTDAIVRSRP